jgi:transcription initiation factor IIE alpha subunit
LIMEAHYDIILKCLRVHGALGKDGISDRTGLNVNQCSRALPNLYKEKLIALTGRKVMSNSGSPEREWRAV